MIMTAFANADAMMRKVPLGAYRMGTTKLDRQQTHYRLDRIDRHEDPLDLDGHKTSNGACWDWCFFAVPFAIFCPCCSILRNELEVRTREQHKSNELHGPTDKGYTPEKPMTSSLPEGASSGKENQAPTKEDAQSAPESSSKDQTTQQKTPTVEPATPAYPGRSSPSLSLTTSGNAGTVTCTVVEDGQHHILHLDQSSLTPILERLSEDATSTAKQSNVHVSPPLRGENMPLGSVQGSAAAASPPNASETVSSPLVSHPTSPRKSIDRPPTPIPRDVVMSPILSARSGHSGRSFHRVPLLPPSDGIPSPVQELVEDIQTPTGPPEARSTIPHVRVEGWLDNIDSPARRESIEVLDHAYPHGLGSKEDTPDESTVANASPTLPAYTHMPDLDREMTSVRDEGAEITSAPVTNTETVEDRQPVKHADHPATALSALGTTITDAIKSLMPVAVQPATNFPEHNMPISRHLVTVPSPEPATRTAVETAAPTTPASLPDDAAATTARGSEAVNTADQPDTSIQEDATDHLSHPNRRPSLSKIPRPNPTTPTIPPRPPIRIPTSFPFTALSPAVPSTPAPPGTYPQTPAQQPVPPTPAPPGRYPATPGPTTADGGGLATTTTPGDDDSSSPFGPAGPADKGPFCGSRRAAEWEWEREWEGV
ncbi:hypothetical protein NKR19_g10404 [Coniochaeta hoffmannii]|uniref:Uncharacterized protein n=1 Tax=Coniochaeta hoffmannii TaxID=91930 RepID=A0AA38VF83_9PEZI|nr:hypothetical protein NKR19_g10404 [Coniochaeta hoffmannii]